MNSPISKLESRFENLKEKFSKEQIVPVFAQFEAEKLLEETSLALSSLSKVENDDQLKQKFIALDKQIKEFHELVTDMIETRRSHNL